MVYAFIIHSIDGKEAHILYYRVYRSKRNDADEQKYETEFRAVGVKVTNSEPLFETSDEKKLFLQYIVNNVHMQYSLKLSQSLIPISKLDKSTIIKGIFVERNWKTNRTEPVTVIWQCVSHLGFSLVCDNTENTLQAQNVLDILIDKYEKYLQLISNSTVAVNFVETVTLVTNQFLPGGQLLFMNSNVINNFEKLLESSLYAN